MTIGPFIDMQGAVDVHVHSEPDLFPRIADDVGVARHAASLGLRAFSLKCHSERTTSRAYMTMQQVPGIQVVGGIVLNRAVGGINPEAVEAALQLGRQARVDADRGRGQPRPHVRLDRRLRQAGFDDGPQHGHGHRGVRRRRASRSTASSTCSTWSPSTARSSAPVICRCPRSICLVPAARERGVEKIMITHPFFKVPALDLETLRVLVDQGAYAEFGYCTVSPMWNHAALTRVVEAINSLGPERCILMSDGGQRHNPMPAECLRVFAQSVYESGDQRGRRAADDQEQPARSARAAASHRPGER